MSEPIEDIQLPPPTDQDRDKADRELAIQGCVIMLKSATDSMAVVMRDRGDIPLAFVVGVLVGNDQGNTVIMSKIEAEPGAALYTSDIMHTTLALESTGLAPEEALTLAVTGRAKSSLVMAPEEATDVRH